MPKSRDFSWKTVPTEEYDRLVQEALAAHELWGATMLSLQVLEASVITLQDLERVRALLRQGMTRMVALDPVPPEDHKRLRVVR
jgi:hypothetical protein